MTVTEGVGSLPDPARMGAAQRHGGTRKAVLLGFVMNRFFTDSRILCAWLLCLSAFYTCANRKGKFRYQTTLLATVDKYVSLNCNYRYVCMLKGI